jgi:hypothetical protein
MQSDADYEWMKSELADTHRKYVRATKDRDEAIGLIRQLVAALDEKVVRGSSEKYVILRVQGTSFVNRIFPPDPFPNWERARNGPR